MSTLLIIVTWLLTVICSLFVGGFLKSYMSKKGENLATHEDIQKLVDQMRAVTTATKEIEAKISGDVWDRQRLWELRRDLLLDAVKKTNELYDAITNLHAVCMTDKFLQSQGTPRSGEKKAETSEHFGKAANRFDGAVSLVRLVCGDDAIKGFHEFGLMSRQLYQEMVAGTPEAFFVKGKEYSGKQKTVTTAIRKELGIDKK